MLLVRWTQCTMMHTEGCVLAASLPVLVWGGGNAKRCVYVPKWVHHAVELASG
jgi:hypothetical protein